MKTKLFATKFSDIGLVLSEKTIIYSKITTISHFNRRNIINFVPVDESFCILIKHDSGESTLLYNRIKLRQYAGRDGLMTGFKIPEDIEHKITNLRYEYLASVELLRQKSGVVPKKKGFFFEKYIEVLAVFKKTHVTTA